MTYYRIMPHGSFGTWWKVQKKFLFFWVCVKSFETEKGALKIIETLKKQDS